MAIDRSTFNNDSIAVLVNQDLGTHTYLKPNARGVIFNSGGGFGQGNDGTLPAGYNWGAEVQGFGLFVNESDFGNKFGEWTIIPTIDFSAKVKLWGAGGGSHSHGGTTDAAGGGGHAQADITFLKGTPYTIWVGQGGYYSQGRGWTSHNSHNYRTGGTFGNGGSGNHAGGAGGGMSGIFFNTLGNGGGPGAGHGYNHTSDHSYGGLATWFRSPGQQNSLLIAGGGGGQGSNTTHGQGGGGGGTTGNASHNNSGGTQTSGGSGGYNSAEAGYAFHGGRAGYNSHSGGGGGGWYGGGGGGHSGGHHDGGAGGSGHALDANSASGYANYWLKTARPNIVRSSYMEVAPGSHSNRGSNAPAYIADADWNHAGIGAGTANFSSIASDRIETGQQTNLRTGSNGRAVITIV